MQTLSQNLTHQNFEQYLLTHSPKGWMAYQQAIAQAQELLLQQFVAQPQPYSGRSPQEITAAIEEIEFCPSIEKDLQEVLELISKVILNHSVVVSHPACIAHLHCPPLVPALAAEVLISGMNQSMDSWDQSPAATHLEQQMIRQLCQWFDYPEAADDIFTSGGTQSNFMGLLLARDRLAQQQFNWSIQQQGLPPNASQFRIFCSEVAHFTVRQAAAQLGLGEKAVISVPTDSNYQMSAVALQQALQDTIQAGNIPMAIVATAGTTDFGSIDPLAEISKIAQEFGVWLHVDAAYGGALAVCDRDRHLLQGIDQADSITIDFHKLFYQPISCGAFLLRDRQHFDLIKLHADYLNPENHAEIGMVDLVTKSVQTTRRFDALKLFISLQTLGKKQLAAMIETTVDLAQTTARIIEADAELELAIFPTLNAVVFRYFPSAKEFLSVSNINQQIRLKLLHTGEAVIAQTQINQQTYLKFTLLNPHTTLSHIQQILCRIKEIGQELLSEHS